MPRNREKRTPASSRRAEKLDSQKINKNNKQSVGLKLNKGQKKEIQKMSSIHGPSVRGIFSSAQAETNEVSLKELQRLREENEMLRRELDAHRTKSAMADADAALYELSASDTRARKAAHAKGETSIPRLNFLGNSNRPVETRKAKRGGVSHRSPRTDGQRRVSEGSRADLAIKLRLKRQGLTPFAPATANRRATGAKTETNEESLRQIIDKAGADDREKFRIGTVARRTKGRGPAVRPSDVNPADQNAQKFMTAKMDATGVAIRESVIFAVPGQDIEDFMHGIKKKFIAKAKEYVKASRTGASKLSASLVTIAVPVLTQKLVDRIEAELKATGRPVELEKCSDAERDEIASKFIQIRRHYSYFPPRVLTYRHGESSYEALWRSACEKFKKDGTPTITELSGDAVNYSVDWMDLKGATCDSDIGGAYIPTPDGLAVASVVNVANRDDRCFTYAVLAGLLYGGILQFGPNLGRMDPQIWANRVHYVTPQSAKKRWRELQLENPMTYVPYLNWLVTTKSDGTPFRMPFDVEDLHEFESRNPRLSISIFTHLKSGRPSIIPMKLSQYTWAEVQARKLIEINLLLLTKEDSLRSSPDQENGDDSDSDGEDTAETNEVSLRHYIAVIDFQRACYLRRKAGGEKDMLSLCRYCMAGFRDAAGLKKHNVDWAGVQGGCNPHGESVQIAQLPDPDNNKLRFKNFKNMQMAPFVIYADFEALNVPTNRDAISEPRHSIKLSDQIPCAFAMVVVRSDGFVAGQHLYRSSDPTENVSAVFFRYLNQINEQILSYLTTEQKALQLTPAEKKAWDQMDPETKLRCWICNEHVKRRDAIREHDHITGKWRGPAHKKCNARLIIHKQDQCIPVVFHNLKNYDSKLIMQGWPPQPLMQR